MRTLAVVVVAGVALVLAACSGAVTTTATPSDACTGVQAAADSAMAENDARVTRLQRHLADAGQIVTTEDALNGRFVSDSVETNDLYEAVLEQTRVVLHVAADAPDGCFPVEVVALAKVKLGQ